MFINNFGSKNLLKDISNILQTNLEESAKDNTTPLDVSGAKNTDLSHLVSELEKKGLVIGKDFFIKSDGSSWFKNEKFDFDIVDLLSKYGVEELQESINEGNYTSPRNPKDSQEVKLVLAVKNAHDTNSKLRAEEKLRLYRRERLVKNKNSVYYKHKIK